MTVIHCSLDRVWKSLPSVNLEEKNSSVHPRDRKLYVCMQLMIAEEKMATICKVHKLLSQLQLSWYAAIPISWEFWIDL